MNWSTRPKHEQDIRLAMVERISRLYGASVETVADELIWLYDVEKIDPFYWADLFQCYAPSAFAEARSIMVSRRKAAQI